jgi:hypothetical protein
MLVGSVGVTPVVEEQEKRRRTVSQTETQRGKLYGKLY